MWTENCPHTSIPRHTQPHFCIHAGTVPCHPVSVYPRLPARQHTCAPHLATRTLIQSPLPPPWLWALRVWARRASESLPGRSRSCAPAGSPPGALSRPPPGRPGGGDNYAARGSSPPTPHAPFIPANARPGPRRSLPPPARSLARVGGGPGVPRPGPAGRRRGRRGSEMAPPSSPWRRPRVGRPGREPLDRCGRSGPGGGRPSVEGRFVDAADGDLPASSPSRRAGGEPRASRPRIAASPLPAAILRPSLPPPPPPAPPSALAEAQGQALGLDEDPVPRWSTRRDPEPLAGVTARPQRRLVSVGRGWRSGRDSEEGVRAAPHPRKSRCRKPQGCGLGRRQAHPRDASTQSPHNAQSGQSWPQVSPGMGPC